MKNPTIIHSLAAPNKLSGQIQFIHTDGKEHTFCSVINRLTGDRLSYFDNDPPTVNDSLKWVKSIFKNIRKKARVIKVIGDF